MEFWSIMLESLPDNWYIMVAAAIAIFFLICSLVIGSSIDKNFERSNEKLLKSNIYSWDSVCYEFFITIISFFPLLGMFGTVKALINLGPIFQSMESVTGTESSMNSLKSDFFLALTSTAWGIICSVIFKCINALVQTKIENQIAKAKKYCDAQVMKNEQK